MEFKRIDFLTPIKEFIESAPFPEEHINMSYMGIDPRALPNTESIGISNLIAPNVKYYVDGSRTETNKINFIANIRRTMNQNEIRRDTGEFIIDLQRWVNEAQENRLVEDIPFIPVFGNGKNEVISASGGFLMGTDADTQDEIYQIQIAVSFDTDYKGENIWL